MMGYGCLFDRDVAVALSQGRTFLMASGCRCHGHVRMLNVPNCGRRYRGVTWNWFGMWGTISCVVPASCQRARLIETSGHEVTASCKKSRCAACQRRNLQLPALQAGSGSDGSNFTRSSAVRILPVKVCSANNAMSCSGCCVVPSSALKQLRAHAWFEDGGDESKPLDRHILCDVVGHGHGAFRLIALDYRHEGNLCGGCQMEDLARQKLGKELYSHL